MSVSYAIGVTKPGVVTKAIDKTGTKLQTFVDKQTVLTTIQRQRIDLLELFSDLTMNTTPSGGGPGNLTNRGRIQLDSFDFKRGKRISITGTASSNETLYDFEDMLNKNPTIKNVTRTQVANRTSMRTTTSSSVRSGSNNRGASSSRSGAMAGPGSTGIKFSMEFDYGTFTKGSR